jgi:hypothetical protein
MEYSYNNMAYWYTNTAGDSLLLVPDLNPDGTEMIFGDAPADALVAGLHALIDRLNTDLGRLPTLDEVDAVKTSAPEMLCAIDEAREVFREDIGRTPSNGEIAAGLAFIDTAITLDGIARAQIVVGDVVRFALWRVVDSRGTREIDRFVDGVVEFMDSAVLDGPDGHRQVMLDVRAADGELHHIESAGKVMPGDESLEEINMRVGEPPF